MDEEDGRPGSLAARAYPRSEEPSALGRRLQADQADALMDALPLSLRRFVPAESTFALNHSIHTRHPRTRALLLLTPARLTPTHKEKLYENLSGK